MFCAMKRALAGLLAPPMPVEVVLQLEPLAKEPLVQERARPELGALVQQAEQATTHRHLLVLLELGAHLLPARLLPVLQQAVRERLPALPVAPQNPASRRNSSSRARTARLTTRRRR